MDGPRDCHIKWSKSDRERQISCDITYMCNLKKNNINELIYKTEIDSEIKNLTVMKGDSGGKGR